MVKYILKRTAHLTASLFIISTITFFMIHSLPGNPIESMAEKLPESTREQVFKRYGLDRPIYERYGIFLKNLVLERDLGESIKYPGREVKDVISQYSPVSIKLGLVAIVMGLILGITMGTVSALYRGRLPDYLVMVMAVAGISIPSFILASVLQYFIAIKYAWLPATGLDGLSSYLLPATALSLASMAEYARYMRTNCLEVMGQDYILASKAKGMSQFQIIKSHVIRNAVIPIITLIGPQIALMFGGAFVIERIFAIPGIGFYFVSSVTDRDYTMIMGQTIYMSTLYILAILLVDILYGLVDPRIRNKTR